MTVHCIFSGNSFFYFLKHLHIHLFLIPAAFDVQYESEALEHLQADGCIFKLRHQSKCYGNMLVNKSCHVTVLSVICLYKMSLIQVYKKLNSTLSGN